MTARRPATVPRCPRCDAAHRPDLRCWAGRYVTRLSAAVLAAKGRVCWLCHRPTATTVDHVIPRSLGGDDTWPNLMPACYSCNVSRGNRMLFAGARAERIDTSDWFDTIPTPDAGMP